MHRKEKAAVAWLEFTLLKKRKEIVHGVFLRSGGFSKSPYDSLNIGKFSGDDPEAVERNRQLVADVLGLSHVYDAKQCHGVDVLEVKNRSPEQECDGLITTQQGIGLLITHADCQAAIFYDPTKRVLANVHCGWRGNVQNIYEKTIEQLKTEFNCRAQDLLVCISPSLGPNSAEFKHYKKEFPESFWTYQVSPMYFDLWAISRNQLISCGVLPEHIEIASLCTYSDPKDFFSYRREKCTGRNATVVAFK